MPRLNAEQAAQITNELTKRLNERRPKIQKRIDYLTGECGRLVFASEEFSKHFADRYEHFSDNWCEPVVQAAAERINLKGIRLSGSDGADPDLHRVMMENDYETGFSEAVTLTLAASRSFALVWGSEDDPDTPSVTFEHPSQAIVAYEPGTRKRRYGLKFWIDVDEGFDYATLYTPDEVWKWQRPRSKVRAASTSIQLSGWEPREVRNEPWPLKNPMGVVPLVEMPNRTLLNEEPMSDLDGVMHMQDAVNLAWAYLFNDLDYMSLPQRIVNGGEVPKIPILDKDGKPTGQYQVVDLNEFIKNRILWIQSRPGQDVKTDQWSAADGRAFLDVVERAVEHIAAQTRTPPHYLIAKMVNTAADALTVAEAGLVSRCGERATYMTPGAREIYRLVCLAQGDEEKAKLVRSGSLIWGDMQYRSEAQRADALYKKRQMGYPLELILEMDGFDPADIPRIMEMVEREKRDSQLEEVTRALAMRDAMGEPQVSDDNGDEDAAGDSSER